MTTPKTTITVTVEGPSYRYQLELPTTQPNSKAPEWRAWFKQLQTCIEHARQLQAFDESRREPAPAAAGGRRCGVCGGTFPRRLLNGPADPGECICWQTPAAAGAHDYQVVVGNVGTVYSGTDGEQAREAYKTYVQRSQEQDGRAAGEAVTLLVDDEIAEEHPGEDVEHD